MKRPPRAVLSLLLAFPLAVCNEGQAEVRFADAGKRLAALPESCLHTEITSYQQVSLGYGDGEDFKLSVDGVCRKAWMDNLRDSAHFTCSEDLEAPTDGGPLYFCYSGAKPYAGTTVVFRDDGSAELLWVLPR